MMNNQQKGFAMPMIIAIVAVVLVVGGVVYYANQSKVQEGKMAEEKAMMEKEAMEQKEKDAMMEKKDGEMMKDDSMMKKDEGAMMDKEEVMVKAGSYESYSAEKITKAAQGDVVLFFRASWCPTCRAVDADIRANLKNIPSDLTILDINYDNSATLKQKYGVTYQHTFVQVDAQGNLIKKWQGSPTLIALVAEVK